MKVYKKFQKQIIDVNTW